MNRPVRSRKIMIIAGEASGDLHGAALVKALHEIDPEIRFYGIGGGKMEAAGVDLVARSADMAVIGPTDAFSRLPFILKVFFGLRKNLRESPPDLLIPIDSPDFNLPLASAAKKCGVPVFYYISPQVWAWRKGRIDKMKKIVDRMAVIFPFEEEFYAREGMEVSFVGHPLLDTVRITSPREDLLGRLGLETGPGTRTIGILPGSREGEIRRHLPVMLNAARILIQKLPSVQFILPVAGTLSTEFVSAVAGDFPGKLIFVRDHIYDAIGAMDIAMVASGTATLETALAGTPMIIVYRVSPLTYAVGRMFIHVDHIGIVNIIAGKTIVPELIQDDVTPGKMADVIIQILSDEKKYGEMKRNLANVREKLGQPGASHRAAELAYGLMKG
jgi:lipid-A-disaccharide synthase